MKNKFVVFGLAALLGTSAAFAQSVENDDMYFSSKDRAKLKAAQVKEEADYQASVIGKQNKRSNTIAAVDDYNLTDSYSARNENPEFAARSNAQTATEDNQDYFVSDYRYQKTTNLNNWNNNFNSWYNNPWYTSSYYAPSIYGWNSPYYGSYYDSWGNPWMNPYYRSGWSSSFSFYLGNSWGYGFGPSMGWGMGMGYGWGNPYNSWYGWNSPYSYMGGFGGGYGWGGGFYNSPSVVVINNNGEYRGRGVAYGKRGSSSGMVTSRQEAVNASRTRPTSSGMPAEGYSRPGSVTTGRVSSEGRMPSTVTRGGRQQDEYYNRGWRNTQQQQQNNNYAAPSRGSYNDSGWNNSNSNNSSGWNRGNSNNSNPSFNNNNSGRSSSFDGGGATRSHSSGSSGGTGGRTRGRD